MVVFSNVQGDGTPKRVAYDTTRMVKAVHRLSCHPSRRVSSQAKRYQDIIGKITHRARAGDVHGVVGNNDSTRRRISMSKTLTVT